MTPCSVPMPCWPCRRPLVTQGPPRICPCPSPERPAGDPEVYPRPDGTVYVTGFPDAAARMIESPGAVAVRSDVTARLASSMAKVSSELGESQSRVELEQACHLPSVPDGVPMLGKVPGAPGAFVATGGGCWGILMGPGMGLAMSELLIDGEATSLDVTPFDPARFY